MGPLSLVLLAGDQARWLAARQKTVAENIAHANTPGYRAADVQPFSAVLKNTALTPSATNANHLTEGVDFQKAIKRRESTPWDISHSGNSVSVDQQMLKASEVQRAYALNTAILKAFSRMTSASLKG